MVRIKSESRTNDLITFRVISLSNFWQFLPNFQLSIIDFPEAPSHHRCRNELDSLLDCNQIMKGDLKSYESIHFNIEFVSTTSTTLQNNFSEKVKPTYVQIKGRTMLPMYLSDVSVL